MVVLMLIYVFSPLDLIPEIEIIVHREGETPESALAEEEKAALQAEQALAEFEEYEDEFPEMEAGEDTDEGEQTAETELPIDETDADAGTEEDEKE